MGIHLRSRLILSSPLSDRKGRTGVGGLVSMGSSALHPCPANPLACLVHCRRRPSRSLKTDANPTGQQRPRPENPTPVTRNCSSFEEEDVGRVDFSDPSVTEVTALIMSCYESTFGKQMMPGMPDDLDPSKVAESLFLDPGNAAVELLHTISAYIIPCSGGTSIYTRASIALSSPGCGPRLPACPSEHLMVYF